MAKIPSKLTFGWNADVWRYPFVNSKEVAKVLNKRGLKVLEVGAGSFSQVAYEFDETNSDITISYYLDSAKSKIQSTLEKMKAEHALVSNYQVSKIDVLNLNKKYDVIIMKSVLGGIFRGVNFDAAEQLCEKLVNENLNDKGVLISLDNAKSIFEKYLSNYGARKNNWHYTTINELNRANESVGFGFFSCFSFSTRFGSLGFKIDKTLYYLDLFMFRFVKSHPTTICSVFVAQNSIDNPP